MRRRNDEEKMNRGDGWLKVRRIEKWKIRRRKMGRLIKFGGMEDWGRDVISTMFESFNLCVSLLPIA